MRSFVSAVPLFPLAFGVALIVAAAFARPVARWLGSRTGIGFLLLASLGLILTATLLPTSDALAGVASHGGCDLSRTGFPTLNELRMSSDTRLNLILFLPLGFAVALVPRSRRTALMAAALLLPFVIEALQLVTPVLGRGCQSADIVDNLSGLVVGLVAGAVVGAIVGPERLSRSATG